jgi:hypothetical protein
VTQRARFRGSHDRLNAGQRKPDSGLKRALQTISAACPWLLPSMYTKSGRRRREDDAGHGFEQAGSQRGTLPDSCKGGTRNVLRRDRVYRFAGTRVNTMWTHNQRKDGAGLVHELLGKLPAGRQSKQGRWDTSNSLFIRFLTDTAR